MKKSEFLDAIRGCTITINHICGFTPDENGTIRIEGLPPEVSQVHKNQVRAWLLESFKPELRPHPYLAAEQHRFDKILEWEESTGLDSPDFYEASEWCQWFENHPDMIFRC